MYIILIEVTRMPVPVNNIMETFPKLHQVTDLYLHCWNDMYISVKWSFHRSNVPWQQQ